MGSASISILVRKPAYDRELSERLKRYAEDFNWVQDNMRDLTEQYLKKYVAVKDRNVRYVADSMKEMVEKILSDDEEISDYIIEYMQGKNQSFIF